MESASAERASQVEFRTLLARDRASLHLGVHHIDNLSIPDDLAERYLRLFAQQQRLVSRRIVSAQHAILLGNGRRQRLIVQPSLQRRVHLEQLHNVD